MDTLKLRVFSINDFETVLKGLSRIVSSAALEVSTKGTKIAANSDSKIRAFISTEALQLISENDSDSVQLCFESIQKLLKMIMFVKDIGEEVETAEFETDEANLYYKGKGSIKLKLDKYEKVQPFVSSPIKTELTPLFQFELPDDRIKKILNYSQFNENYEVKLYFYIKDKTLMCDIDDKQESVGRLTRVSIPITNRFRGVIDSPFVIDINDLRKINIFDRPGIKVCLCAKSVNGQIDDRVKCIKVASDFENEKEGVRTNMFAVVRLLKA